MSGKKVKPTSTSTFPVPVSDTILVYWDKHKLTIAQMRGWCEATLADYEHCMEQLTPHTTHLSMGSATVHELIKAINLSGKNRSKKLTILRDLFSFAEARGDAVNDLRCINSKEEEFFLALPSLTTKKRKKMLKNLFSRARKKRRSLTVAQQHALVRLIIENIKSDGRWLAIAILLYTGIRPSECRGLTYGDLLLFVNHQARHMLSINKQLDKNNKVLKRLKTDSGFRKIGVHIELEKIIQMRLNEVFLQVSVGSIDPSWPLCCYENHYDRPCSVIELSHFITMVLRKSIHITNEVLETCYLDMCIKDSDLLSNQNGDCDVCPYLLRHNFWTWMQASTTLSADEKRYFMGHSLRKEKTNIHTIFNNEDQLYKMLLKLDHDLKYLPFREEDFITMLSYNTPFTLQDIGYHEFCVPQELLMTGGTLSIQLMTNNANDPIIVETRSPSKGVFDDKMTIELLALPGQPQGNISIIMDYDNYLLRNMFRPARS